MWSNRPSSATRRVPRRPTNAAVLVATVWILWYRTDGVSWHHNPLRFRAYARCQAYAALVDEIDTKGLFKAAKCLVQGQSPP
jgi:hypothetical protein